jgi:hypothetical protein
MISANRPLISSDLRGAPQESVYPCDLLLRVRPFQLAGFPKTCLHIRRQPVATLTNHTFRVEPVPVFGISLLRATPTSRISGRPSSS